MAEHGAPLTSEELAACFVTNPVVVRRALSGLREAGIVSSGNGRGGGWALARPASKINLLEVYSALGAPGLFHVGPREASECLIDQAVNEAMAPAFDEAAALIRRRLSQITLADINGDFRKRRVARKGKVHAR
jgi:DNA-binding IscR family transcriptional regulator